MFVIYGLQDPRNQAMRYIGITEDVYTRFREHLRCDGTNPRKDTWIRELQAANCMVLMIALETVETISQATEREAYWIAHYRHLKEPLTNQITLLPGNEAITPAPPRQRLNQIAKMTPDERRELVVDLWNAGMTRREIHQKTGNFIRESVTNQIIADAEHAERETRQAKLPAANRTETDLQGKVAEVLEALAEGINTKDGIISRVWKVNKGSSKDYQRAGLEYEQVMRIISSIGRRGMEIWRSAEQEA